MNSFVTIVIPAFNQLEYCRGCLNTLWANTTPPYRLVLVDNGSTDGVSDYFDEFAGNGGDGREVRVVHTGQNLGFAGGVNAGLAHAEGHVLLLNSDTVLPVEWLDVLRGALAQDERIGMVGPRSNNVSGAQQVEELPPLTTMEEVNAYAAERAEDFKGVVRDAQRLVGFCLLIRDSCFQKVGLLDDRFGLGNYEDDDYCWRALLAGYRLVIADDGFVYHYGSRTFLGMGIVDEAWQELMEKNQRLYQEKWANEEKRKLETQNDKLIIREYRDEDEAEWMRVHAIIMSISHAWNYTIQERPKYAAHPSTRLVAELEGRIVGLTDVQYENEVGEFCFLKDSLGGYVLEFGRLPEYTGHNIGARLIEATVSDAKTKGFCRLEYWSQDRGAQRFYRRLGMPEIGRHYRFRMKPPAEITDLLMRDNVGTEYLYCACMPEEWPLVKQKYEVIDKHPLEPHLCVGFEVRF